MTEIQNQQSQTNEESVVVPEVIKIGEKQYTAEQILELERGNLRNADYTRKTQALAERQRELEGKLNSAQGGEVDVYQQRIQELEQRMLDMAVEREVDVLSAKYKDFDAKEALDLAVSKRLNSLEDAYHLIKATKGDTTVSKDDLEKEMRKKIIAEIEAEKGSTITLISGNDSSAQVKDNTPKLSPAEAEYCKKTKTSPEEYIKWKNYKR